MVSDITGYHDLSDFAKRYVGRGNRKGVSRVTIHYKVKQEIAHPGSTDIDVVLIGGHTFAKHRGDISHTVERNRN